MLTSILEVTENEKNLRFYKTFSQKDLINMAKKRK